MTIEDLSARLEKVERQYRMIRAGGICVLVLAAAWVTMGQAAGPPREIKAGSFSLVDSGESVLARLDAGPDGGPGLALFDGKGRVAFGLSAFNAGGVTMRLGGKDGHVNLSVGKDGSQTLRFGDDQHPRAILGVTDLGGGKGGIPVRTEASSLVLFDKDGKVIERLPK